MGFSYLLILVSQKFYFLKVLLTQFSLHRVLARQKNRIGENLFTTDRFVCRGVCMTGRFVSILLSFAFLAFSITVQAQSRVYFFSDLDGTLFNDRTLEGGTFLPPVRLLRINSSNRSFSLLPRFDGPESIIVDLDQCRRLNNEAALAKNGIEGNIAREVVAMDGTVYPAGYYEMSNQFSGSMNSFEFFKAPRPGQMGYLTKTFLDAIQRDPKGKWKGFVWELAMFFRQSMFATSGWLTLRAGPDPSFEQELLNKKLIRTAFANTSDIWLGNEEYDAYDRKKGAVQMKAKALKALITQIESTPLGVNDQPIWNADGDNKISAATLIVAEDQPEMIEAYFRLMSETASRKRWERTPVKFILIHAGSEADVQRSGRPRYLVVTSSGNYRDLKDDAELFADNVQMEKITERFAKKLNLPSALRPKVKVSGDICARLF